MKKQSAPPPRAPIPAPTTVSIAPDQASVLLALFRHPRLAWNGVAGSWARRTALALNLSGKPPGGKNIRIPGEMVEILRLVAAHAPRDFAAEEIIGPFFDVVAPPEAKKS